MRYSWELNMLKAHHMHLLNEHMRVQPSMALWAKLRNWAAIGRSVNKGALWY